MEWVLFEMLIALLVAVGIVWWTMSGRRKDAPPVAPDQNDDKRQ